ncbi:hypothetical protein DHEL01_v202605 [Diaporthe helianthi]|uniref:DNA-binding protein RAP1 n=1 Tax=Diaporthe helianthi TaxID=158607 RepID=A0A2P5I912_DIAHE|nr:hypothetical protein DHEL01_v202605 [Diaporthe helianthi]
MHAIAPPLAFMGLVLPDNEDDDDDANTMPVVYDGTEGSGHGDLFQGMKLFISYRVPQRERWVKLVKGNGGEVVPLENQADMLIADHLKRNGVVPPPGSYSWQWIQFSVQNGFLQSEDDYRIQEAPARPAGASRAAGTTAPARGQRSKFTAEDDDVLARFVWDKEQQGCKIKGNVIFEELDRKAQGRTRFTEEDDEAILDMVREVHKIAAAKGTTVRGLDGNKVFEELAEKNNRHTAQSWRNRWVRHLKATFEQEQSGMQDEAAGGLPGSPAVPPKPQTRASRESAAPPAQAEGGPVSASAAVPGPRPPTQQRPRPGSDGERLKRQEERKRRARAAMLLQRSWRGHVVRRDRAQLEASIVPLQSLMRGYLLRMRKAKELLDALERNDGTLEHDYDEDAEQYEDAQEDNNSEVDRNYSSLRDQFYEDLRDYIHVSGAKIELRPIIHEREIELWDLFSTATQQNCAVEDRDWKQIAQRLGFDWTKAAFCAEELKGCYDRNLAEFEEAIGSYDDEDGIAMGDDEQGSCNDEENALVPTSDAVTAPKQLSPAPLFPTYRSSSPIAGAKRSFQQSNDPQSDLSYPSDRSSKRRRRDREAAIPQTPEHKLRYGGGSGSRTAVQNLSSPLKPRGAATEHGGIYAVDEADAFLNNGIHDIGEIGQLPDPAPAKKHRFIEPETQDFGHAMGSGNGVRQSIENDIGYMTDDEGNSPSQQLQSEFEAFTSPPRPIPIRGNGAVSTNGSIFAEPRRRRGGGPATNAHSFVSGTENNNASAERAARKSISSLKATKRSLPQQYRTQQAVATAARPPASAPVRNGIAAPPLQSRSPVMARPTDVYPNRQSDVSNHQYKQNVAATSSRAVRSSAQPNNSSRKTPASSAPLRAPPRTEARADTAEFGLDYTNAQFEHFQALGYATGHIASAMEAASLQRGPMTVVLQSLHAGKGIPQEEEGVWTDYDDEKLRKIVEYGQRDKSRVARSSSGQIDREEARVNGYRDYLLKKHKPRFYAIRLAFKDMMDSAPPKR